MALKQFATKIDEKIKDALDDFCDERGLKISRFLEDAILDKIEEHEDLSHLRKLRAESYKPFEEIIKELKSRGKL